MFLPLISITGVTGTFFRALAIAMSVSLLTSLALALTWSTNLGVHLIRRGQPDAESANARGGFVGGFDEEAWNSQRMKRMMAAEEESLKGGWFETHHRVLRDAGCAARWNIRSGSVASA